MPTAPPIITDMPPAPSTAYPTDFDAKGDAVLAAWQNNINEMNALGDNVFANATEAAASATDADISKVSAAASATAAAAAAGAQKWVSGTTYSAGTAVWSPANSLIYRRTVAGAGTVDPSQDTANWAPMFINGFLGVDFVVADKTLTAADAGRYQALAPGGGATLTVTMPAALAIPIGKSYPLQNVGSGAAIIALQGADSVDVGVSSVTSITLAPGESMMLVRSTGSTIWYDAWAGRSAPTAPQFDNAVSPATTEFVQRALGSFSGAVSYGVAAVALTAADVGKAVTFSVASTATLPDAATVPPGASLFISAPTIGNVTLTRAGANTIQRNDNSSVTSFVVEAGTSVRLRQGNGGTAWLVVEGDGLLKYSSLFGASLAANGYQRLPSGLIMQWGTVASVSTNTLVTLPITFPNAILTVVGSDSDSAGAGYVAWQAISTSQIRGTSNGALQASYFALGF